MLMNIHTRRKLRHEFNPSVLLTVELVLMHEIRSYIIVMDVFKTLKRFGEWNKFCVRKGAVTPAAVVNADRPQTVWTRANEDAVIAVILREPWRNWYDICR